MLATYSERAGHRARLAARRAGACCCCSGAGRPPSSRARSGSRMLVLVCTVAIRLPGRGDGLARWPRRPGARLAGLPACSRRDRILGPAVGIALPVGPARRLLASLPFIASGQIGIPGVGLNNDMAMHLVYAEYLLDHEPPGAARRSSDRLPDRPAQPRRHRRPACSGPSRCPACSACWSRCPVLTAITSLAVLRELPAGPPDSRRRTRLGRLPDRLGARNRRLQGAARGAVPDRLRARAARDRAQRRWPRRDRDRPRR